MKKSPVFMELLKFDRRSSSSSLLNEGEDVVLNKLTVTELQKIQILLKLQFQKGKI